MRDKEIVQKIPFGSKIKFTDKEHCLCGKELCCLGICKNAIAVIEWNKRGSYNFDFYTYSNLEDIEIIEVLND